MTTAAARLGAFKAAMAAQSAGIAPLLRLLAGETTGAAFDFTGHTRLPHVYVKGATNSVKLAHDFFSTPAGGTKRIWGEDGLIGWQPHNLFLNSEAPATQNVTLVVGEQYTVSVKGTGSLAGSAGASGTAAEGAPSTFTATTTTGTFTVTGTLSRIQINKGPVATAYLATTGAVRYGAALERDPVTGKRYWLIEPTGVTNLALWSRDFTTAAWTKTSINPARATGADGVLLAGSRLTATAGNATVLQAATSASAGRVTSMAVKRVTGTGDIQMTQDNGSTWTTVTVTGSWTRVSVPAATLANPTFGIRIVTSGDAIEVDFFQHAVAGVISSPVPTFGETATRAADEPTFALSQIPWSATELSYYLDYALMGQSSSGYVFVFTDDSGTNAERAFIFINTNYSAQVVDNSAAQMNQSLGAAVAAQREQIAHAIALNSGRAARNGALVGALDSAMTMPTVTRVLIGRGPTVGNALSEPLRLSRAVIVPRRVADGDLAAWKYAA